MTDIERVARAICEKLGVDPEQRNGVRELWTFYKGHATAAIAAHIADIIEHGPSSEMIAALSKAGLVIVPREPTEAMRVAAQRTKWKGRVAKSTTGWERKLYRAMIAAHTEEAGE